MAKIANDFVGVFEQLLKLHERNEVHGDIRAYNMLFAEGIGGLLVDFDYCGKNGIREYPPGYWTDLPDTKRHARAKAGMVLQKDHDCFSLGAVMEMYDCTLPHEWQELCRKLQLGKPDLSACLEDLKAIGKAALFWKGEKVG